MYQHFYGLRELPFELTPNPRYLFLTGQHREALSALEYGLSSAKPITALIGETGTGKTTLIRAALESERCRHVSCVYINNPALTRNEFIETLSSRFSLSAGARHSKAQLLDELEHVLLERRQRGQITALVIDEAQSMSDALLEEIRLLANSETATEKLLPLVLAGQPELRNRLNETNLRQLKQRVTIRCEIGPMTLTETAAYMAQRIRIAGGDAAVLFTREAVCLIHELSDGLPRLINVISDNTLLTGCGMGRQPVDRAMVQEVARDLDLGPLKPARVNTPLVPVAPLPGTGGPSQAPAPAANRTESVEAAAQGARPPAEQSELDRAAGREVVTAAPVSPDPRELFEIPLKRSRIFSFLR